MVSSPEAGGSSSSSEEEMDLNQPITTNGEAKPANSNAKLFSDDEDEDEEEAAPKSAESPKAAADDDRKEKEMEDLFGSDYDSEEEEFKASGIKESPVREENRVANDMFADDANDTAGGRNDIWIPKTPKARKGTTYYVTKMPNILRLVPDAYTKQSIEEDMRNPSDEMLYRNYVRWRYQRNENGRIKMDPKTDRPLRESNTKLVQWEDGTLTMFVGREALNMSRQKLANSFLFVNEMSSDNPKFDDDPDATGQETVLECHGRLNEKLTIRPMTTASKSHKSLTMSMRAKHNKGVQKIKQYISELDGYREQEQRVKITDDRLRLQNRKKARQTYEFDRERSSRMDASFLEEGYDGIEYDDDENVGAIKEQYGSRDRKQAASRKSMAARRPPPAQSSFRGGGFDEYRKEASNRNQRRDSDSEQDQGDDDQDDDEEEEEIVRSTKKRRMVDEDSD